MGGLSFCRVSCHQVHSCEVRAPFLELITLDLMPTAVHHSDWAINPIVSQVVCYRVCLPSYRLEDEALHFPEQIPYALCDHGQALMFGYFVDRRASIDFPCHQDCNFRVALNYCVVWCTSWQHSLSLLSQTVFVCKACFIAASHLLRQIFCTICYYC